ncbi:MAG: hypothetical protein F6K48_10915 [Okeania sp. SIO3H1]|nr:hypothetical protein [Okeania sp. SIO3H1]
MTDKTQAADTTIATEKSWLKLLQKILIETIVKNIIQLPKKYKILSGNYSNTIIPI